MEQLATYLAPIATTIAALIVASNLGARITGIGFVIFTVGSLCWVLLGFATGQSNLLWQNIILTGLNLFGIWRWLGWQARVEEGAGTAARESQREPAETLFPASLLTKAKVVSSDGQEVGSCVDAMAGSKSGVVRYVVVSEGGVAGVGETLRRLSWNGCEFVDDRLQVPIAMSQFCALEPVEPDHWPAR